MKIIPILSAVIFTAATVSTFAATESGAMATQGYLSYGSSTAPKDGDFFGGPHRWSFGGFMDHDQRPVTQRRRCSLEQHAGMTARAHARLTLPLHDLGKTAQDIDHLDDPLDERQRLGRHLEDAGRDHDAFDIGQDSGMLEETPVGKRGDDRFFVFVGDDARRQ